MLIDVNSPRVLVKRRSPNGSDTYGDVSKNNTRELLQVLHSKNCLIHARLLNRVAGSKDKLNTVNSSCQSN